MGQGGDHTRDPGSAVRDVFAVRHVTNCATPPVQRGMKFFIAAAECCLIDSVIWCHSKIELFSNHLTVLFS